MRTLLAGILAFLPLVQAQDSRLLKSVEPNYDEYSEDLATDFTTATASVIMTVAATGKPFALDGSNLPLPVAVVMALKEYGFQPQSTIPHGRTDGDAGHYQVKLTVPIRQSKDPVESPVLVGSGISKGLLVNQVRPVYPEDMKASRIEATIVLEARITKQGEVGSLKTRGGGPFAMIEATYDAVKQWQYRPYLLNREPVEIQTDIYLNFALN